MTVGELKKALSVYADDTEVITKKTDIFGNVGYVNSVTSDKYAFFGRSVPCVLLTDEFAEDEEDNGDEESYSDSDTISRKAAIDSMKEYEKRVETAEQLWTIRGCKDGILKLPSAGISAQLDEAYRHGETEAEARYHDEIVQCKDCVRADSFYHCDYMATWHDGECFCSYGKRRTDDSD